MIITVYIDESGTHSDAAVMTFAGLVARSGQWKTFDGKWRKLLAVNDIDHIHLRKLRKRAGQFQGWSKQRQDRLMSRAGRILHKNTMFGFSVALPMDEYRNCYRGTDRPAKVRFDSAYGLCFRHCLSIVVPIIHEIHGGRSDLEVYFVLENGHANLGDGLRVFNEMKASNDWKFGWMLRTCTPGEKRDYPGLQGADIPAHISYDYESKNRSLTVDLDGRSPAEIVKRVTLGDAPIFHHKISGQSLADLRQRMVDEVEKRRAHGKRPTLG